MQLYPIDIHTHRPASVPGEAIVCCPPEAFKPQEGNWYSIGIHPWLLEGSDWKETAYKARFESQVSHPQVLAVGEAGLDKLIQTPLTLQLEVFRYQATLANAIGKPLIIHGVKATDELLALRKELKPSIPWIIHGFRGKAAQAESYLRHGFHLSFGEKYNEEALRQVPIGNLFIETDESPKNVNNLYERAARVRNISSNSLKESVLQNIRQVFFSR